MIQSLERAEGALKEHPNLLNRAAIQERAKLLFSDAYNDGVLQFEGEPIAEEEDWRHKYTAFATKVVINGFTIARHITYASKHDETFKSNELHKKEMYGVYGIDDKGKQVVAEVTGWAEGASAVQSYFTFHYNNGTSYVPELPEKNRNPWVSEEQVRLAKILGLPTEVK